MAKRAIIGKLLGSGVLLIRPPALFLGPLHQPGTAGNGFGAAATPAGTIRAGVWVDDDVADVAGVARRALNQPAIKDEPAAHPGRDHHSHDVVPAAPGAPPVLGRHHANCVIVYSYRDPAQPVGQSVTKRKRSPSRDVQRRNKSRRPIHRPAAATTTATQIGR